ncbi:MAG: hypothetical protein ACLR8L_16230 [Oscillospiraceae bacterium]
MAYRTICGHFCMIARRLSGAARPVKPCRRMSPTPAIWVQVSDGGLAKDLTDEFLLRSGSRSVWPFRIPLWLMGTEHIGQHFMNAEVVAEASRGNPSIRLSWQGGGGKEGPLAGVVPKEPDVRQWNRSVIARGR